MIWISVGVPNSLLDRRQGGGRGSGHLFGLCPAFRGDAGGSQACGLLLGGPMRQASDDFAEVVLRIYVLGAAVAQQCIALSLRNRVLTPHL